jgi:hypothetical protein
VVFDDALPSGAEYAVHNPNWFAVVVGPVALVEFPWRALVPAECA